MVADLNPSLPTGLAKRVIPCLEVVAGRAMKAIRLPNLRERHDLAQAAQRFAGQGADEIVFLVLADDPERPFKSLGWLEAVAERVFIPLTVGGGVRSLDDARRLLQAGADKVAIGRGALKHPELLSELAAHFGEERVVLSVSACLPAPGSAVTGWEILTASGRAESGRDAISWIVEAARLGAGEILLASVHRNGARTLYDVDLIRAAVRSVAAPIVASGEAEDPESLAQALRAGAAAALAASIFQDGAYSVAECKRWLDHEGLRVRTEAEW